MNYIDLFAGAGGLSEGFIRQGFIPMAHVESDNSACFTLRTRASYYYLESIGKLSLYYSYLKGKISREKFYSFIPDEVLNSVINAKIGQDNSLIFKKIDCLSKGKTIDIIIGGPPCQAYSYLGRAALKHKMEDERNTLYIHYGRFLNKYKPKVFVFENVPGFLTAGNGKYFRNLQKYYKRIGYLMDARLLNAYNYDVVQNRERVIIIGWQKHLNIRYPDIKRSTATYTRNDIFNDLPAIKQGENSRYLSYSNSSNHYLKKSRIRNGKRFVTQHITRVHNEKDIRIYKLAIQKVQEGIRLKNNEIPIGIRTQQNIEDFLDRFKVVDVKPHALIAHIAKDGHHFIHPDIQQLRSISVREAARIQSFPDDYYFEGTIEGQFRTAAFRQIGNAVPPLLAEKIAFSIRNQLSLL